MRKNGFTLPELLAVIAIIACLMMASVGALRRARILGRRAKSEAQLRQLVSAWQQYYTVEVLNADSGNRPKWPPANGTVDVSASLLEPLTNPKRNNNGIVFFNYNGTGKFIDPVNKKQPYRLVFGSSSGTSEQRATTTYETTVALPRRTTILP